MYSKSFAVTIALLLILCQSKARSQDFGIKRESSSCYSCLMQGGGRKIPLLSVPEGLDRSRGALDRSIGGIGGSSFQTQSATAEQTIRAAQIRRAQEPVFVIPENSQSIAEPERSFADRNLELRSFEQRVQNGSYQLDSSLRPFSSKLDNSFNLFGTRSTRSGLQDLFSVP